MPNRTEGLLRGAGRKFKRLSTQLSEKVTKPVGEAATPPHLMPPECPTEVAGRRADAQVIYEGRVITNDDPLINNWYHTIELAPGLVTGGYFDHRPIVDRMGLPKSLKGKTALDAATGDGFWSFELERRGAEKVVAIDVRKVGDYDLVPPTIASRPKEWFENDPYVRYKVAHKIRGSKVDYRKCNIYDLSPQTVGMFDVVYCGSLMLHLFDPLQALINLRSVTKEMAVIETEGLLPGTFDDSKPWALFGCRGHETPLGEHHIYWHLSERAFCDMLLYAGFSSVEPQGQFWMTGPGGGKCFATPVVARV